MLFFCLENLSAHVAKPEPAQQVSQYVNPRPAGFTKEQFREWGVSSATRGKFLSVWSGVSESARVSASNPAVKLHGIIGDYDSSAAESRLSDLPKACGVLPTFIISTFTEGKIRLVWVFETPVTVGDSELTERFLKELDKRIRFSKALPGYDKCSVDSTQYFEVGTNWREVEEARPIPQTLLEVAMIDAGIGMKATGDTPPIPLNLVEQEVKRQFPGRWNKAFEPGQRGPLFWIPDGVDREGCIVTENGMVCFSDRAASNFMPWKQVLGAKFVQEFEEQIIGSAALTFYFDGRQYYRKLGKVWTGIQKDDARMQLRCLGVSDIKRKGQMVADLDQVLNHIQLHRRVYAAAPIPFHTEDIFILHGSKKILNTNAHVVMQPAETGEPSQFPWIFDFINNAFEEGIPGVSARDHFLGWLWWFYDSALHERIEPGQILVLVGPTGIGKSFINQHLIGAIVGGSYDAVDILMKSSSFNKGAGEVGHWRLDDVRTDGSYAEKRAFTQNLKRHAASPSLLYQPKFCDALELPYQGRVCCTLNPDAESLSLLPAMEPSVQDKIMLQLLSSTYKPKFRSKGDNEAMVKAELPYFLRWLLDLGASGGLDHVKDENNPRFGIKNYHHPDLIEKSHAETPEYAVQELLEVWCVTKAKDSEAATEYTASELLQELRAVMPESTRELNARTFGRQLTKLIGQYSKIKGKRIVEGISKYQFEFKAPYKKQT